MQATIKVPSWHGKRLQDLSAQHMNDLILSGGKTLGIKDEDGNYIHVSTLLCVRSDAVIYDLDVIEALEAQKKEQQSVESVTTAELLGLKETLITALVKLDVLINKTPQPKKD